MGWGHGHYRHWKKRMGQESSDITTPPQYSDPTPTIPLEDLAQAMVEQIKRERDLFLMLVDERERLLGISPRTAEIRRWWKDQNC